MFPNWSSGKHDQAWNFLTVMCMHQLVICSARVSDGDKITPPRERAHPNWKAWATYSIDLNVIWQLVILLWPKAVVIWWKCNHVEEFLLSFYFVDSKAFFFNSILMTNMMHWNRPSPRDFMYHVEKTSYYSGDRANGESRTSTNTSRTTFFPQ